HHLWLDGPCGVPGVGVLGDETQHTWLLGSDQNARPALARSTRTQERVLDVIVAALEGDMLAVKHACDNRQRLLKAAGEMIKRIAERGIFGLIPASAQTKDEAATADLVHRVGDLGQQRRLAETRSGHQRRDLHTLRRRRERREDRERLPGSRFLLT